MAISKLYKGTISTHLAEVPEEVKRAYRCWTGQRQRARAYGILVEYTSREFITWWLQEISKKRVWCRPSVSRKDHSGNYCFGNIKLEELGANVAERNRRVGPRKVYVINNDKIIFVGSSIREAASYAGVAPNNIPAVCEGRRASLGGLIFRYG